MISVGVPVGKDRRLNLAFFENFPRGFGYLGVKIRPLIITVSENGPIEIEYFYFKPGFIPSRVVFKTVPSEKTWGNMY